MHLKKLHSISNMLPSVGHPGPAFGSLDFGNLISRGIKVCLLFVLCMGSITTSVSGVIILSGDATPAYYAAADDNNVFFANILQGGNSVVVHDQVNPILGGNLDAYYNSLLGVSSTFTENSIVTSDLLSGVDLFVTSLYTDALTLSETDALSSFLDGGGSVLFMGETAAAIPRFNTALTSLGSSMSLYGPKTDIGDHYAMGTQIDVDPFTAGVNSFHYGSAHGVSGGTSLFRDEGNRTFYAYEGTPVPEPATLSLLSFGLFGLLGIGQRRKKK